jgi:hypothetical protein
MNAGDRVSWSLSDGTGGTGVVVEETTQTHVLVAVDPSPDATRQFYREAHIVIFCAKSWLEALS